MEYALRDLRTLGSRVKSSLNPYSNGICSASQEVLGLLRKVSQVLILILMEYAL